MQPFDAYSYYLAMKLHFEQDDYDAPRYNFKTSAKPQAFWKRRDKYHFAKLAKMFPKAPDLINFYASQFVNEHSWVGDMLNEEENYKSWQKRNQSLGYTFEQDINKLSEEYSLDGLLAVEDGQYPAIIKSYLADEICIETVVILDKLTGFMKVANKQITDTILWPGVRRRITKYGTFVLIDKEKMKKIVLKVFTK